MIKKNHPSLDEENGVEKNKVRENEKIKMKEGRSFLFKNLNKMLIFHRLYIILKCVMRMIFVSQYFIFLNNIKILSIIIILNFIVYFSSCLA